MDIEQNQRGALRQLNQLSTQTSNVLGEYKDVMYCLAVSSCLRQAVQSLSTLPVFLDLNRSDIHIRVFCFKAGGLTVWGETLASAPLCILRTVCRAANTRAGAVRVRLLPPAMTCLLATCPKAVKSLSVQDSSDSSP